MFFCHERDFTNEELDAMAHPILDFASTSAIREIFVFVTHDPSDFTLSLYFVTVSYWFNLRRLPDHHIMASAHKK